MTPEKLHLALNHLPFLGSGFALIPLLLGIFKRSRTAIAAGLLIAALSGLTTPLVMDSGEDAYERYKKGPISAYLDPQAAEFLEEHEHRAHDWAKIMYASALAAILCLGLLLWKPRWLRGAALVSALLCALSLATGIWIADSGDAIRRIDFRAAPASPSMDTE